jgi:glutaredoxin
MARSIILFSRSGCAGCARLHRYLEAHGIAFEEVHGDTAEGRARMLTEGIFLQFFPALSVDGRLYEYASLISEDGNVLDLGSILA